MIIGVPKESAKGESRVALVPDIVKKLTKKGFKVIVEAGAGITSGYLDVDYKGAGSEIGNASEVFKSDIVLKVQRPLPDEILRMKSGCLLVSFLDPYKKDGTFEKLAEMRVSAIAMELIPRTSRAQSMDALSSQANIAGYRAVLEAAHIYGRFFPMMMTSAGSAKPARIAILGVGVAGLQAISTAKRLGAMVEAYDVRPEVKEQIISVGAKVIELDVGEKGEGEGGYARELSEDAKSRQQSLLTEKLKKFDVIISTANIPGRKSPILITEEAVKGMRQGSVIVDMAAANGGNCPLSEADKTVFKNGVTIVGETNFPRFMPGDASGFFGRNLTSLLGLMVDEKTLSLKFDLEDDIIAASLVTHNGAVRIK